MTQILIADDDKFSRSMLRAMLENKKYHIEEADDGEIALNMLRKNPADIVITDIVMPNKEGIETITQIRKEFPHIKIIAISGGGRLGPKNYLKLAKRFGADYVFNKPIDQSELLGSIEKLAKE